MRGIIPDKVPDKGTGRRADDPRNPVAKQQREFLVEDRP
jgi:hypothetical protein